MLDPDIYRHYAAEDLLDDEALTDDLVDEAARPLLNWGIAQVEALLHRLGDLPIEEIESRLSAVRQEIKRISRQAGQVEPRAQAERVQTLLAEQQLENGEQG